MRQIQTAGLAAAVALVFATAAQAAVMGTVSTSRTGPLISNAPRIQSANTAAGGATSSGSSTTLNNTATPSPQQTTVDLRNQQTLDATAGTHASGSTSALGPLANGAATVNGTQTGTTSGLGATGSTTLPPYIGTPMYANPSDSTTGVATTNAPTTSGFASTDAVYGNAAVAGQGVMLTEAQVNSVNVNRAINQVSRDRKRVGRNGQLLYSIAPRGNVDRTAQMPDDPPVASLTGSNSTLTR